MSWWESLPCTSTGMSAFSEEHQRVIEVVSRQIAPIVRRSLDGADSRPNRSGLGELPSVVHLRQFTEAMGITELPRPTSILLITVDAIVEHNRSQAAIVGEQRLAALLDLAKRYLRPGDLVFRQGTSELLILFLKTDVLTASSIGERINRAAQETNFPVKIQANAAAVGSRSEHQLSVPQLVERAADGIRARTSTDIGQGPSSGSIH